MAAGVLGGAPDDQPGGAAGGADGFREVAQSAAASADERKAAERQLQDKLNETQKRLKALMEVNRKLHSTLAEKKIHAAELKKANEQMLAKLEAREVEEMGRQKQLEELEAKLQIEQTGSQQETLDLQKKVMSLEERIELVNEENTQFGERHKQNKATIAEQSDTMKNLTRRSKELLRQIEFLSGHLNESQLAEMGGDLRLQPTGGDSPGRRDTRTRQKPKSIEDFKNLAGLDLTKLLGQEEPRTAAGGQLLHPPRGATLGKEGGRPDSARSRGSPRGTYSRPSSVTKKKERAFPGSSARISQLAHGDVQGERESPTMSGGGAGELAIISQANPGFSGEEEPLAQEGTPGSLVPSFNAVPSIDSEPALSFSRVSSNANPPEASFRGAVTLASPVRAAESTPRRTEAADTSLPRIISASEYAEGDTLESELGDLGTLKGVEEEEGGLPSLNYPRENPALEEVWEDQGSG